MRRRWGRRVIGVGGALTIAVAAVIGGNRLEETGVLLRVLDPPGAGYDSTNGVLYTGSGGAVTFTRADTWTCRDSDGTIRSLASGAPCVVDGHDGAGSLRVRSAVTNVLLHSAALDNAAWAAFNAPAVTADSWDFGTGAATGETIDDNSLGAAEGQQQTVTTSATGAWTLSCFLAAGTSTKATLWIDVTGGSGGSSCTFADLTATAQRKTCSITAGAGVTALVARVTSGNISGDTGSIKVGGCQLVAGSQPGDYCPTGASSDTCAAESATVDFATTPAASPWCVRARLVRSANDAAWNAGAAVRRLWTNDVTGNGYVYAYVGTGGSIGVVVNDSSAADKTWATAGNALTTNSAALVRICYDGSAPSVYVDRASVAVSSSGAGTGVLPGFATSTYLGSSAGGAAQLNASLDQFCFASSLNGCQ